MVGACNAQMSIAILYVSLCIIGKYEMIYMSVYPRCSFTSCLIQLKNNLKSFIDAFGSAWYVCGLLCFYYFC